MAGLANSAATGAPDRFTNPYSAPPRLYRYPPQFARIRPRGAPDHAYSPILPPRIDERSVVLRGGGPRGPPRDADDLLSAFLESLPRESAGAGGDDGGGVRVPLRSGARASRDAALIGASDSEEAPFRPRAPPSATDDNDDDDDGGADGDADTAHAPLPEPPRTRRVDRVSPLWNSAWAAPERVPVPDPAPGLPPVRYRLLQGRFAPDAVRAATRRAVESINHG